MGLSIETKHGNIVISGDLKLEHEDGVPTKEEQRIWSGIGKNNNILLYADSTNAERGGFSTPESVVNKTLEEIITNVKGRLILYRLLPQAHRWRKLGGPDYCCFVENDGNDRKSIEGKK